MRFRTSLLLCLAVMALPIAADAKTKHAPAPAPVEKQLIPQVPKADATYDVYVGGVHFITTDIIYEQGQGTYHAKVTGQTQGFWNRFFPWHTELDSRGGIRGDRFQPAEFFTHDQWGEKKPKSTMLHFKPNGDITPEFDPPKKDDDHALVTAEQRRGAYDPVTALLQMLAHLTIAQNCNVSVPVFDGHLLFNVTGADLGSEDIDEEDYGIYKGTARTCTASFNLVAGEWKEKVKSRFWQKNETEKGREPFKLYIAKPNPDLPEIPVRIETGSLWGLIIVHLSKWQVVK